MATIADLKKSITQMDDQEAFNLIKEVRFLRRQAPIKKSRKTKWKTTKPKTAKAIASAMTPEQRANLLKELEGL